MIDSTPVTYKFELRSDEWALVRSHLQSILQPKVTYNSGDNLAMANEAIELNREVAEKLIWTFYDVWEALGYD